MIPGVNPKQMQQMMKRMGMKQTDIAAEEVIIRTADSIIRITNPEVAKVNAMGQETYQISGGEVSEEEILADETVEVSDEDITTVSEQTGASLDDAKEALVEANGDLAQAIMSLSEE